MKWTNHLEADLRRLWRDGHSGQEIADALGCTRNAVLGKLQRLGLLGKVSPEERTRRTARGVVRAWERRSPQERERWIESMIEGLRRSAK